MGHTNDRLTKALSLVVPTSLNLQPRPFAPLESEEKDETIPRKSGYSENFLEKIINTPSSDSATPVQRKSGNRLKAIAAERINPEPPPFQRKSGNRLKAIAAERQMAIQAKQSTDAESVVTVQRKSGNKLKAIAAERMAIQAKLAIGEPNDKYEQEADATAARVVQQIHSSTNTSQSQSIQRQDLEDDDELQMKPLVQRRENLGGGEASTDLESSIQSARGGGQSLDANLQQSMGQAMGADFSGVKVHTDSQSDQLNKSIQAKAFTTGQDLFFRQGAYEPSSRSGQELIAHELTHVVQQNGGAVQRSQPQPIAYNLSHVDLFSHEPQRAPIQMKLSVGGPSDVYEQEADRVAKQITQREYTKSNLFTPIPLVQRMPDAQIQRTMAGAYEALVGEGRSITHLARAKKVFTLGFVKSTYDQLLDATLDYEKEEKRGKKKLSWFHNQLNRIVTLCNDWLNDQTHVQEVGAKDKLAVSRASAIRTLLARAQNEQLSLGGNSEKGDEKKEKNFSKGKIDFIDEEDSFSEKGELEIPLGKQEKMPTSSSSSEKGDEKKEKNFSKGKIDFIDEEDSFSEKGELETPLGKQEKMPTSSSSSVTPKYDFKFKASTQTAQQREAIFNKYVDNFRLAGLPLQEVLTIARRIVARWEGWDVHPVDFNYAYLNKFSDLLQDEVKGASLTLVKACFTMNPNLEQLQAFAQEFGPVTTPVEDDFALDNEEEFVTTAAKQFDNKGDDRAFIKLWNTADPALRQRIYSLVSLNKEVRGLTSMTYLVEALDKKHRYDLHQFLESWTRDAVQVDFFTWLESKYEASQKTSVRYYNPEERQQFAISVGAVLKRADGEALVGDNIFVLSQNKTLYAANKETTGSVRLHHSSFLSGEPVLAAGHLYTHGNGSLYKIDNSSGHYGPNNSHLAQALAVLKQQGVPLEKVSVSSYNGGTQTAEEFLSGYL